MDINYFYFLEAYCKNIDIERIQRGLNVGSIFIDFVEPIVYNFTSTRIMCNGIDLFIIQVIQRIIVPINL